MLSPLSPFALALALATAMIGQSVFAQAAPPTPTPTPAGDDIVVVAERGPGSVDTDVPVDEVLSEAEIASYGASNFADLIGQLAVRTRSGGGRGGGFPVILLNGRRISGFAELRNMVPEAIERVEIFPPEVALQFGYAADQRVVNIILKRDFSALTANAALGAASAAERWTQSGETSLLRLTGKARINLTASMSHQGAMREYDRGIVQASGNAEDGRRRTLLPESTGLTLDGTIARPLSDVVGASLNLTYGRSEARSLLGPSLANPGTALRARSNSNSFHAGASSDGRFGEWRWSLTGNFDRGGSRTVSDTIANPATPNRTQTRTNTAETDATLSGSLFALPAGAVRATMQGGWKYITLAGQSDRAGAVTLTDLSRTAYSASTNVDVPIASRDDDVLALLGDVSLNARYALRDVSDFRTLTSWTAGTTWSPVNRFDIIATWTSDETAPSVSQLGAPSLTTPLRSIYDFTLGQTVLADVISGGNANLRAETRRDFRAQANWRPIEGKELLLTASYARVRSRNTTADFPLLTPEIEAAFPGRVTRGSDGRIISVDQRPVNFEATHGRQIRYGISFARQFGVPQGGGMGGGRPPGGGGVGARVGGGGGGRGGGFGVMFGGPGSGGRWSIAAYHTVRLEDEITIRSGVPILDLLNGSATGGSGGSPRHEVEFDGGWFFKGVGFRANGTWRAGTRVVGGAIPGGGSASDLTFSPVMTINLRGFIDINQQTAFVAAHPLFRGTRIRVAIDNLFADTQEVRDGAGLVPLRYQPGYLNPVGRTIEVSLRKLF